MFTTAPGQGEKDSCRSCAWKSFLKDLCSHQLFIIYIFYIIFRVVDYLLVTDQLVKSEILSFLWCFFGHLRAHTQ